MIRILCIVLFICALAGCNQGPGASGGSAGGGGGVGLQAKVVHCSLADGSCLDLPIKVDSSCQFTNIDAGESFKVRLNGAPSSDWYVSFKLINNGGNCVFGCPSIPGINFKSSVTGLIESQGTDGTIYYKLKLDDPAGTYSVPFSVNVISTNSGSTCVSIDPVIANG